MGDTRRIPRYLGAEPSWPHSILIAPACKATNRECGRAESKQGERVRDCGLREVEGEGELWAARASRKHCGLILLRACPPAGG